MSELHEDIILEQLARITLTDEEVDGLTRLVSELDDEEQEKLADLLTEDVAWAKLLADNILEKGQAVSRGDLKGWQAIEDREDLALVKLELKA